MSQSAIDPDVVQRIAALARLQLDPGEVEAFTRDFRSILDYVAQLEAVEVAHVTPTTHAVELASALREDAVRAGLAVDEALAAAPERVGDGFGVPKVIE